MSHQPTDSKDLNDIIDRYSSLTPSSSPSARDRQPYDSSPRYDKNNDPLCSLQSSPPLLQAKPSHARNPSTNSGYLSRSKLFGRIRTKPTPNTSLPPRYLHRVSEVISGPLSCVLTEDECILHVQPLRRDLRDVTTSGSSAPSLGSSQSFDRSSAMRLHGKIREVIHDDLANAVSPKPKLIGRGYDPGLILGTEEDLSGHGQRDLQISLGRNSKISPAEKALRLVLAGKAQRTEPEHDRTSSWDSYLFPRRSLAETPRSSFESVISDDSISEFEYVQPKLVVESPQAILNRVRARDAALKQQPQQTKSRAGCKYEHILAEEGSRSPPSRLYQGASLIFRGASPVHDSVSGIYAAPSSSLKSLESLETLPPQFSDDENPMIEGDSTHTEVYGEDPSLRSPAAALTPLVYPCHHENLAAVEQELVISSTLTVIHQEPEAQNYRLSLSAMVEVINHKPTTSIKPKVSPFFATYAIIYDCTTFAVVLVSFMEMIHDFQCETDFQVGQRFLPGFICLRDGSHDWRWQCLAWSLKVLRVVRGQAETGSSILWGFKKIWQHDRLRRQKTNMKHDG